MRFLALSAPLWLACPPFLIYFTSNGDDGLPGCQFLFRAFGNQEPIILFMATIGLAYFMEGFGDLMWGSDIKKLDVGIPQGGNVDRRGDRLLRWLNFYGFFIDKLDIVASLLACILVIYIGGVRPIYKTGHERCGR